MLRTLFRILRLVGDAKAAARGPGALGRRVVRRRAHRTLARVMRRGGL
jgi:hypothetical protein